MIKVLHPGIYCTVQDGGRIGFAKKGIPQAGAMDAFAAKRANLLLNNQESEAVVEITFGQGKFQFHSDTWIALTGGDFTPKLDATSIQMNSVVEVKKGAVLSFGKRNYGARVYLAVQGGIQSELVLNSRSFFPGITQVKLAKGAMLPINARTSTINKSFSKIRLFKQHYTAVELECFPGPEFEQLDTKQKQRLIEIFTISEENNRVGYRLDENIENDLPPIVTSSVLPGTVQLTPSGKLIVLMRDCQVTGGYPRVLQLTDNAVSRLSQKVAGDEVGFCVL